MAGRGRSLAQEMKRDVRILQNKLADLSFFTEDFRENSLQINARVMANLDIFNIEFKQMTANKRKIESLETKVDGLQTTIQNLLSFLGIEERQRQEVLLVSHRGASAVPKMRDVEVQVAADVDRVEVEKKNVIVQTKVTQTRDTGIQCFSSSADASVQTTLMATPNVEAGLGATAAGRPLGSDVPKNEYVTATERMRAAEGEMSKYGPTLLCTDDGAVEWGPPADKWTEWVRGGGYLDLPYIILPVSLGGGKVLMWLRKEGRGVKLRTGMPSDAYNNETKRPIKATVKFSMTDSTTMKKCDGQGVVNWARRGYPGIPVCDLDGDVVLKMKSPIIKVTFL